MRERSSGTLPLAALSGVHGCSVKRRDLDDKFWRNQKCVGQIWTRKLRLRERVENLKYSNAKAQIEGAVEWNVHRRHSRVRSGGLLAHYSACRNISL
ncbi:uncharacterized protein G2W53_020571 [Senna tora]|uniref:Uncharacterized protein n=1 Tax=Senna tora TaxID=362788 RepID=A0A834TY53_9FABA|nr:uncharacterized protein G2W53_020571 [Senna tora]